MSGTFFTSILEQIFTNQQAFHVQISVHLKKVEQYLFGNKTIPSITYEDAEILYLGLPSKKIQGLYGLSGNTNTFGLLKKSSYYALQLIYKSITMGKNKEIFLKILTQSDEEDFKLMRLATHINNNKNQNVLQICAIIKEKRPYLNQSDYIFSEQSRQIFSKWFLKNNNNNKKKKNKNINNNQIEQKIQNNNLNNTTKLKRKQTIRQSLQNEFINKITTNIQQLQFYDDYVLSTQQQYYLDTFLDVIDILKYLKNKYYSNSNHNKRNQNHFKILMYYLINTPISHINSQQIITCVQQIHLQSKKFNPKFLLQNFHLNINQNDKLLFYKIIPIHFNINYQTNIIKYYFEQFVNLEKQVTLLKQNFCQNQTIKNSPNISLSLRTKMKYSMKQLYNKIQPLHNGYNESEKFRKLIQFFQNNTEFVKLPIIINQLLEKQNIQEISKLYNQYLSLIKTYKNVLIVKEIISQIEQVIVKCRIKQMQIAFLNYNLRQCELMFELFEKQKSYLQIYLVPKMIYQMIKELELSSKIESTSKLQKQVKKYQILSFGEIIDIHNKQLFLSEQQQGDLLEQYLKKININKRTILKCLELNQYVKNKIINLFKIIDIWNEQFGVLFEEKQILYSLLMQYFKELNDEMKNSNWKDNLICAELLLQCQKYTNNQIILKSIQQLQEQNFNYYCTLIEEQVKNTIKFNSYQIKQDFDGNYYNFIMIQKLDIIIKKTKTIINFPTFKQKYSFYQSRFYHFVIQCLNIEENLLKGIPEILTYLSLINCIIDSSYMKSFYNQMIEFPSLKNQISQKLKKPKQRVQELFYSFIRIDYASSMKNNKQCEFALQILDYLKNYCLLISEYSRQNYKKYTRFVMQAFLVQAGYIMQNENNINKIFIRELEFIQIMTNKIISKKIQARWQLLLSKVTFTAQENKSNQNYIMANKHRYSQNYCVLLQY